MVTMLHIIGLAVVTVLGLLMVALAADWNVQPASLPRWEN